MNTQNTHTPGPWKTAGLAVYATPEFASFGGPERKYLRQICSAPYSEDAFQDICLDSDPHYLHRVNGVQGTNFRFPSNAEAEANARLIAAAPELLAALERARDDLTLALTGRLSTSLANEIGDRVANVYGAAIAKAQGGAS